MQILRQLFPYAKEILLLALLLSGAWSRPLGSPDDDDDNSQSDSDEMSEFLVLQCKSGELLENLDAEINALKDIKRKLRWTNSTEAYTVKPKKCVQDCRKKSFDERIKLYNPNEKMSKSLLMTDGPSQYETFLWIEETLVLLEDARDELSDAIGVNRGAMSEIKSGGIRLEVVNKIYRNFMKTPLFSSKFQLNTYQKT